MNAGLAADLARWERGEIRAEQLVELYPETRVDALVEMHAFVSYLVSEGAEEPGPSWDALEARLPDREPERAEVVSLAPRRLPIRRVIAAFVTGAVLAPAAAAADKPAAIRELNDRVGRAVTELFTADDAAENEDAMGANVVMFVPAASEVPIGEATAPPTSDGAPVVSVSPAAPATVSAPATEGPRASRPTSPTPASAAPTSPPPSASPSSPAPEVSPPPVATQPVAEQPAATEPAGERPSKGQGTPPTDRGNSEQAPGQVKKSDSSADPGRSAEAAKGRPAEVPGRGDDRRRT